MGSAVFVRAANLTVALDHPRHDRPNGCCCRLCGAQWRAAAFQRAFVLFCVVEVPVIMKLSTRLTYAFFTQWIDWRRRDTRDAIVLLAIGIITFLLADRYV